jgi:nucleoside diphosphate kinase
MANARETSLVLVKQDGVQRGLVGEVISRFENRGFKIVGLKFVQVSLPSSLMIILFKTIYLIFFLAY